MKKISNAFLMSYIILFPLWMNHTGYAHLLEAKYLFSHCLQEVILSRWFWDCALQFLYIEKK